MAKPPGLQLSFLPRPTGRPPWRRRSEIRRARLALRLSSQETTAGHFVPSWGRIALTVLTIFILSALFSLHLLPDNVRLHVGDVSDQEVRSFRPARYIDQDATQSLRKAASDRVDPVYAPVRYAASEADQTVTEIFARLRHERLTPHPKAERIAEDLRQQVGIAINPPTLLSPLLQDRSGSFHVDQAERLMHAGIHDVMQDAIRADNNDDLQRARQDVAAKIHGSLVPQAYLPALTAMAQAIIRPNLILDKDRTEAARESEERLVAPQYAQLFTGDIVVRAGEIVTPSTIDKLRALGLQNPRLDPAMITSVTLIVTVMVTIVILYMRRFHRKTYTSTKLLGLLSLLVILGVIGLKVGEALLGVRLSPMQFGFVEMLSVASVGMLVAALIHPRVAMICTSMLAAQAGLVLGTGMGFAVITLIATMIAIFAVSDIRSRTDVLRAAVFLAISNVVLCLLVSRMDGDLWSEFSVKQILLWAVISGIASVTFFSLGTALFERLFAVTTHLGLLELSDPNRPLLQRFCQVAPGTYTHSVMVGNLAVSAAEAIGADALLCRVGAYYHDLGKMRRAEFFIENQNGGDNIHERLNPSLSALVVTAHVKDGLEIAEYEKLPPVIKAFITEHHGTSLIKYFYHQHTNGEDGDLPPGLENHFRYGGPKPQSRESAILMLADGVEAASRTLAKPTLGRIEDLVDKIITAQLSDGQLDDCDLTLRDLRGIRDAFVRLLGGMLHTRIDYPEMIKTGTSKTQKNAASDQPTDPLISVAGCASDADAPAGTSAASGGSRR